MAKKVLLFGATGRVGTQLVQQGLAAGWDITAFVRKEDSYLPEGVSRIVGDVMAADQVMRAIQPGYDAVLSAIGPRTVHAKIRTTSVGTANICKAMNSAGIKRMVAVAGAGILQYTDSKLLQDLHSFPPQLKTISDEHHKAWRMLESNNLAYTLVCPGYMPTQEPTGEFVHQLNKAYERIGQIGTGDVATMMVQCLNRDDLMQQRVALSQPQFT